ncbi:MAG: EscU/YscU/HrcU family type III secretion system export apparatus switch protein [Planctomycetes bacterium]|nr:EscU/YscU/HrcU family type III secretion system export apparatus switch protein [Planctomycetota bacterium]
MGEMFDKDDRTEEATAKHRGDAHERGNFARSQDLSTALLLLAIATVLIVSGRALLDTFRSGIVGAIRHLDEAPTTVAAATSLLRGELLTGLRWVLPFLGTAAVVSAGIHFSQAGGFRIARDAIKFDVTRLDPMQGFGKIFSLKGFSKVGGTLLKTVLVIGVLWWALRGRLDEIAGFSALEFEQSAPRLGALILSLFLRMCAALVVLGFVDYLYQRWQHNRDLRMTKQQVRDEAKNEDGDPQIKRKIKERMRAIVEKPLRQAVAEATVVITNPTHFAVALEYQEGRSAAPRVVAKGADLLAQEIRRIARDADVPVIEQPPLARALFREVKVGDLVPESLYRAVASVLALVWRLREQRKKRSQPAQGAAAPGRK